MSLYQLIAGKSFEDLEEDYDLRVLSKDYPKFLEKVKNIVMMGDGWLRKRVREILLYVLNERHEDRPTFTELCKALRDDRKIDELEGRRILMEQATRNEEGTKSCTRLLKILFNELQEEYKEVYEKVKSAYYSITAGSTSCNLHSVCIGDTGAKIIAFALNESRNLKELNLGFNKIGPKGIKALAEGLKRCRTLETLILGKTRQREERYYVNPKTGNRIEDVKCLNASPDGSSLLSTIGLGLRALGNSIRSTISPEPKPELRTQIVDDPELYKMNNLGTTGTKAIANYLRNSKLRHIDLSYCNIKSKGMKDLLNAANDCNTLTFIIMKGNSELEGRSLNFRSGLYNQ